ncbi:hypothetical protein GV827_05920 [Sulfitobacter sp. JBTF-M27]|uniref:Uncharacterized protein n=1 Tax=Sulfitobacter sediminilitoris TaxID=2698830 RepID=A0A6P0C9Z7_9RHOB|nr:hypothetical protein [Sulfitobacter sediminilitoris]NEK21936.1 hypothetical protein [Sulfitobacter sediminilitoris]
MADKEKEKKKKEDQMKKDKDTLDKGLKALEKVLDSNALKRIRKTFNKFESAAKTGKKVAEAGKEVSKEHQIAKKAFVEECMKKYGKDENFRGLCHAEWSKEFGPSDELSKTAKKSFTKIFAEKLPEAICKRIDSCAKELEKMEKAKK